MNTSGEGSETGKRDIIFNSTYFIFSLNSFHKHFAFYQNFLYYDLVFVH